ncbi:hypothetical protein BH09ACT6_BH09ACT6_03680 [soil metagenome]
MKTDIGALEASTVKTMSSVVIVPVSRTFAFGFAAASCSTVGVVVGVVMGISLCEARIAGWVVFAAGRG